MKRRYTHAVRLPGYQVHTGTDLKLLLCDVFLPFKVLLGTLGLVETEGVSHKQPPISALLDLLHLLEVLRVCALGSVGGQRGREGERERGRGGEGERGRGGKGERGREGERERGRERGEKKFVASYAAN